GARPSGDPRCDCRKALRGRSALRMDPRRDAHERRSDGRREHDVKASAALALARRIEADLAPGRLDETPAYGQAEARPFADGLRGHEGLEDTVADLWRHPRSVVFHFDPYVPGALRSRAHQDPPWFPLRRDDRRARVEDEVQQHLGQLRRRQGDLERTRRFRLDVDFAKVLLWP